MILIKNIENKIIAVLSNKKLVAIILFILVLTLKLPILNVPYHWDEMVVALKSLWMYQHNFYPITSPEIELNPPLFNEILAISYFMFGHHLWLTHLVVVFFSFLALFFTYLLGRYLYDEMSGFLITLLLFFSPLFFSQSGIANFDMPLTAFSVMTLYFFLKGNTKYYSIAGSCLVLTKVPGRLLLPLILFYCFFKNHRRPKKELSKILLIHSIPIFVIICWILFYFSQTGEFHTRTDKLVFSKMFDFRLNVIYPRFLERAKDVFIHDYKWILSGLTLSYFIFLVLKRQKDISLLQVLRDEYEPIIPLLLITFFYAGFFSLMMFLPRYLLLAYPLFFIFFAKPLTKNKFFLISIIIILIPLFITKWTGSRTSVGGSILESNLEYLDMVKVDQEASKYIETNFPNATVLTGWHHSWELSAPQLGYVTRPIKVKTFSPDTAINTTGSTFELIPSEMGFSDVDLVYVSNLDRVELENAMNSLNLTLLKRFEKNGKFTEIYRVSVD